LATPKKDVVQSVGRILRKVLKDGDIRPLIIDIADHLSLFKSQANVREKFYDKNEYVLQYYYLLDENLISPKQFVELQKNNSDGISAIIPESFAKILSVPPVEIIIDDEDDEKSENNNQTQKNIFDMFGADGEEYKTEPVKKKKIIEDDKKQTKKSVFDMFEIEEEKQEPAKKKKPVEEKQEPVKKKKPEEEKQELAKKKKSVEIREENSEDDVEVEKPKLVKKKKSTFNTFWADDENE
jgi:hypothetical protein